MLVSAYDQHTSPRNNISSCIVANSWETCSAKGVDKLPRMCSLSENHLWYLSWHCLPLGVWQSWPPTQSPLSYWGSFPQPVSSWSFRSWRLFSKSQIWPEFCLCPCRRWPGRRWGRGCFSGSGWSCSSGWASRRYISGFPPRNRPQL